MIHRFFLAEEKYYIEFYSMVFFHWVDNYKTEFRGRLQLQVFDLTLQSSMQCTKYTYSKYLTFVRLNPQNSKMYY